MSMVVSGIDKVMSLEVRGQLGFCAAAGFLRCGHSRAGAPASIGGIYQRTLSKEGWVIVRKRYHRPTNPQTVKQQAWRANLTAAWPVYNALTAEQKKALMVEARKYRLSGPSLFISRYLQAKRA